MSFIASSGPAPLTPIHVSTLTSEAGDKHRRASCRVTTPNRATTTTSNAASIANGAVNDEALARAPHWADYSPVKLIGQGGFGLVYLCRQHVASIVAGRGGRTQGQAKRRRLGESREARSAEPHASPSSPSLPLVAVKVIPLRGLSDDEVLLAMTEVSILKQLDHRSILRFEDSFMDDAGEQLCLVTEYATGGDLAALIRSHQPQHRPQSLHQSHSPRSLQAQAGGEALRPPRSSASVLRREVELRDVGFNASQNAGDDSWGVLQSTAATPVAGSCVFGNGGEDDLAMSSGARGGYGGRGGFSGTWGSDGADASFFPSTPLAASEAGQTSTARVRRAPSSPHTPAAAGPHPTITTTDINSDMLRPSIGANPDPAVGNWIDSFRILDIARQCLDGLAYLHSLSILHRDIKPANLYLMMEGGAVKIGDFGVSTLLSPSDPLTGTFIGTPFYVSPELCLGEPYSFPADVWALGVVTYELYCLQLPFSADNVLAQIHAVTEGVYDTGRLRQPHRFHSERLSELQGLYGDDFERKEELMHALVVRLVESMLVLDPLQRPSAEELLMRVFGTQPSYLTRPNSQSAVLSTSVTSLASRPASRAAVAAGAAAAAAVDESIAGSVMEKFALQYDIDIGVASCNHVAKGSTAANRHFTTSQAPAEGEEEREGFTNHSPVSSTTIPPKQVPTTKHDDDEAAAAAAAGAAAEQDETPEQTPLPVLDTWQLASRVNGQMDAIYAHLHPSRRMGLAMRLSSEVPLESQSPSLLSRAGYNDETEAGRGSTRGSASRPWTRWWQQQQQMAAVDGPGPQGARWRLSDAAAAAIPSPYRWHQATASTSRREISFSAAGPADALPSETNPAEPEAATTASSRCGEKPTPSGDVNHDAWIADSSDPGDGGDASDFAEGVPWLVHAGAFAALRLSQESDAVVMVERLGRDSGEIGASQGSPRLWGVRAIGGRAVPNSSAPFPRSPVLGGSNKLFNASGHPIPTAAAGAGRGEVVGRTGDGEWGPESSGPLTQPSARRGFGRPLATTAVASTDSASVVPRDLQQLQQQQRQPQRQRQRSEVDAPAAALGAMTTLNVLLGPYGPPPSTPSLATNSIYSNTVSAARLPSETASSVMPPHSCFSLHEQPRREGNVGGAPITTVAADGSRRNGSDDNNDSGDGCGSVFDPPAMATVRRTSFGLPAAEEDESAAIGFGAGDGNAALQLRLRPVSAQQPQTATASPVGSGPVMAGPDPSLDPTAPPLGNGIRRLSTPPLRHSQDVSTVRAAVPAVPAVAAATSTNNSNCNSTGKTSITQNGPLTRPTEPSDSPTIMAASAAGVGRCEGMPTHELEALLRAKIRAHHAQRQQRLRAYREQAAQRLSAGNQRGQQQQSLQLQQQQSSAGLSLQEQLSRLYAQTYAAVFAAASAKFEQPLQPSSTSVPALSASPPPPSQLLSLAPSPHSLAATVAPPPSARSRPTATISSDQSKDVTATNAVLNPTTTHATFHRSMSPLVSPTEDLLKMTARSAVAEASVRQRMQTNRVGSERTHGPWSPSYSSPLHPASLDQHQQPRNPPPPLRATTSEKSTMNTGVQPVDSNDALNTRAAVELTRAAARTAAGDALRRAFRMDGQQPRRVVLVPHRVRPRQSESFPSLWESSSVEDEGDDKGRDHDGCGEGKGGGKNGGQGGACCSGVAVIDARGLPRPRPDVLEEVPRWRWSAPPSTVEGSSSSESSDSDTSNRGSRDDRSDGGEETGTEDDDARTRRMVARATPTPAAADPRVKGAAAAPSSPVVCRGAARPTATVSAATKAAAAASSSSTPKPEAREPLWPSAAARRSERNTTTTTVTGITATHTVASPSMTTTTAATSRTTPTTSTRTRSTRTNDDTGSSDGDDTGEDESESGDSDSESSTDASCSHSSSSRGRRTTDTSSSSSTTTTTTDASSSTASTTSEEDEDSDSDSDSESGDEEEGTRYIYTALIDPRTGQRYFDYTIPVTLEVVAALPGEPPPSAGPKGSKVTPRNKPAAAAVGTTNPDPSPTLSGSASSRSPCTPSQVPAAAPKNGEKKTSPQVSKRTGESKQPGAGGGANTPTQWAGITHSSRRASHAAAANSGTSPHPVPSPSHSVRTSHARDGEGPIRVEGVGVSVPVTVAAAPTPRRSALTVSSAASWKQLKRTPSPASTPPTSKPQPEAGKPYVFAGRELPFTIALRPLRNRTRLSGVLWRLVKALRQRSLLEPLLAAQRGHNPATAVAGGAVQLSDLPLYVCMKPTVRSDANGKQTVGGGAARNGAPRLNSGIMTALDSDEAWGRAFGAWLERDAHSQQPFLRLYLLVPC